MSYTAWTYDEAGRVKSTAACSISEDEGFWCPGLDGLLELACTPRTHTLHYDYSGDLLAIDSHDGDEPIDRCRLCLDGACTEPCAGTPGWCNVWVGASCLPGDEVDCYEGLGELVAQEVEVVCQKTVMAEHNAA